MSNRSLVQLFAGRRHQLLGRAISPATPGVPHPSVKIPAKYVLRQMDLAIARCKDKSEAGD